MFLQAEYSNRLAVYERTKPARLSYLDINFATRSGIESHEWDFELPHMMVKAKPSKGTGSLNTHSRIQPFGTVRVTVKPVGRIQSTSPCPEMTSTHQAVRLTGHLTFDTRSKGKHRWGSLTGAFHSKGVLDASYGDSDDPSCFKVAKQRCVPGASGSAFGDHPPTDESDDLLVSPSATGDTLIGSRGIALNAPKGASRDDQLTVPAKAFTVHQDGETFSAVVAAKRGTGDGKRDVLIERAGGNRS
jgi:hypothetical protein